MAEIKLTKNELRIQQTRLGQLEKYLPTLRPKKAMLQAEVQETRLQTEHQEVARNKTRANIEAFSELLSTKSSVEPLGTSLRLNM